MPLRKCNGIQDSLTGFWLVAYDPEKDIIMWGFPSKALCFTEEEQTEISNNLTNLLGRVIVGGRPDDRP